MKAKVTKRGQITIPKALRQKLGIKPGMELDLEVKNNFLLAVITNPAIERAYGCLGKLNTDEIINFLRGH